MNNERYQEIIDEAYKKYRDSHWTPPSNPNSKLLSDQLWSLIPQQHNRDTFIKEIKTNPMFSERWGLNIEERELSQWERVKMFEQKTDTDTLFFPVLTETLTFHKIPTKLITITYNNEKIEVFK